jgi:hypothetical protein
MQYTLTKVFAFAIFTQLALCLTSADYNSGFLENYQQNHPKDLFKVFHSIYQKTYELNSDEGIRRYKIFKNTLKEIKEHNAKGQSYKKGITVYADITKNELSQNLPVNNNIDEGKLEENLKFLSEKTKQEVTEINWAKSDIWGVEQDYPKKDFLPGSMWIFAGRHFYAHFWGFMAHYNLQNKTNKSFCIDMKVYGDSGKSLPNSFKDYDKPFVIIMNGFPTTDSTDPAQCNALKENTVTPYAWQSSYDGLGQTNMNQFLRMLSEGPILTHTAADWDDYNYKSGIYEPKPLREGSSLRSCYSYYAILIVGRGVENGVEYWIIKKHPKNSGWGDEGTMKVKRDDSVFNYGFTCNQWIKPLFR